VSTTTSEIDGYTQAILTVPEILRSLGGGLAEDLAGRPGRCPACGFHLVTQGHAIGRDRPRLWNVKTFPVLLAGTDTCRDCGEPYGQEGLTNRCLRRHWRWQKRPCARCSGAINYDAPRFLSDDEDEGERAVNPKSLLMGRIVPPARGRALGWGLEQIDALWNRQPVHAACAGATE
jgi:hypothetical protein